MGRFQLTWMKNLKSKQFMLEILGFQLIFYAVVFLDIPVARQVIGFVYLTFVPGLTITKILNIGSLSWERRILFSVGFSITFLLFGGLLINMIGPTVGVIHPLSLIPLVVTLSPAVLVLAFLSCFREDAQYLPASIDRKSVLLVAFVLCLPAIAIAGDLLMVSSGNNSILLILIALISVCFSATVLIKRLVSPKLYALVVFVIGLALLFHSAFMSNYVMGADIQLEYFVCKAATDNGFWYSTIPQFWDAIYGRFNSMLSITIFPAIYSSVLGMDPTWVLKIIYPLVFSFVPVGLFLMWKPYVGRKRAFFSIFLFVAQLTFYTEMIGLDRQMIAELFSVLLFTVLLSRKMSRFNRSLCFIVFAAALVVSHYALSYIFMGFIAFAWALLYFLRRSSKIRLSMVVIFVVLIFSWYVYTSNAGAFESFLKFGNYVVGSLGDFLDFGSRSEGVLRGIGLAGSPTFLNTVSRGIAYLIQAFIVVGFLSVFTKRTNIRFSRDYVVFALASISILAANILLPGFAQTMNVERFYHVTLIFLAPFFVIGLEVLIGILKDYRLNSEIKLNQKLGRKMRRLPTILTVGLLVSYFLFQTNFLYVVAGSPSWSIPLSKQKVDPVTLYKSYSYFDDFDVFGVKWLKNANLNHTELYADLLSTYSVLTSYGMIYRGDVMQFYYSYRNVPKLTLTTNGIVYLSPFNVVYGYAAIPFRGQMFVTNFTYNPLPMLNYTMMTNTNKIYSNGACEINEWNR
jgi:uncharacterized membrane protein